ncbi:LacI family DNA-binding transcriptional regulator [Microbacterium sp. NPDC056234]|uniref:LacI family DNA-binding transcriptional regulator n=1 Tax=Microbacterium sp. NPDC056234 TaxID=3345757 RepID=UPI0035E35333
MPVSMSDVARHAGVSQRTVSNVVNNYVHVSPQTRARVEASLRELGYRPNVVARQLRSGRSGTITLALPGLRERYFADLAEAVIDRARGLGLRVLIETTGGDRTREIDLLRGGGDQLTDGVILSALTLGPDDDRLERADYPLVLISDREYHGPLDHVGIPNREAAAAAVHHLAESGRTRIALLGAGKHSEYSYSLRRQGFDEALAEAGLTLDPALGLAGVWTRDEGERLMTDLLHSGAALPDAIFGMNDSIALGAMRALVRAGIRIPEQVMLIGFDDIAEARYSTPSLSTIALSRDGLAASALELLSEQFEGDLGDRPAQHRRTGFELKVRESTSIR